MDIWNLNDCFWNSSELSRVLTPATRNLLGLLNLLNDQNESSDWVRDEDGITSTQLRDAKQGKQGISQPTPSHWTVLPIPAHIYRCRGKSSPINKSGYSTSSSLAIHWQHWLSECVRPKHIEGCEDMANNKCGLHLWINSWDRGSNRTTPIRPDQ